MSDSASSLARTIARQYDLLQASLEFLQKNRKFLNWHCQVEGMPEIYPQRVGLPTGVGPNSLRVRE